MHPSGDRSPPPPARPEAKTPELEGLEEVVEKDPGTEESSQEQEGPGGAEDDSRRPTPVRMAMDGGEASDLEDEGVPRVIEDLAEGARWIVTVVGRSVSGILPLRTVPVMELSFAKEEAPNEALKTVLCFGGDLTEIPDHELLTCLERSGPFREPMRPREDRGRKGRRTKGPRPPKG